MKSRLIALDIDGTILDKPAGIAVPAAVREAVRDAREDGARVCLCSSRPCFFMKDATGGLSGIDALVGCSGAVIEIPGLPEEARGEVLYIDTMPWALASAVFETAKRWDLHMSFAAEEKLLVCEKGPLGPPPGPDSVFSVMEDSALLKALRSRPVSCAFIFLRPETPGSIVKDEPALAGAAIHRASQNSFVITNRGTDKGTGVMRLAKHWGIPREAVLAVGNDENDVPMLEAAGVGVAVANACPEILAAADWIAPDVRDGGAADAIRRFAL